MNQDPAAYFRLMSVYRMTYHYLPKLLTCIESLDERRLWEIESGEDGPASNSIGGIILHILEQMKRHVIKLSDPDAMFAVRLSNYFPVTNVSPGQLKEQVEETFKELTEGLENVSQFDMYSLYHLVEHTSYHLGQIIDRSQRLTGLKFQFVQNGINESQLKSLVDGKWNEQFSH